MISSFSSCQRVTRGLDFVKSHLHNHTSKQPRTVSIHLFSKYFCIFVLLFLLNFTPRLWLFFLLDSSLFVLLSFVHVLLSYPFHYNNPELLHIKHIIDLFLLANKKIKHVKRWSIPIGHYSEDSLFPTQNSLSHYTLQ